MNTWLAKLRISALKDSGKALPPELKKRIENSRQLQAFSKDVDLVEDTLKEQKPPSLEVPPDLHRSIMAAVREERHRRTLEPRKLLIAWWYPAMATVALLIGGLVHFWPGPTKPSEDAVALSSAVSSLTKSMELARTAPEEVVAPLSEELKRLRGDVENAKAFLMASLP